MSEGDEQIQYLTRAIREYSDCCYGDGVTVGAYARFVLAERYRADGDNDKADKLNWRQAQHGWRTRRYNPISWLT